MNKVHKTCCQCGRNPVSSSGSKYCQECRILAHRMRLKRYPRKVIRAIWRYIRKHGFVCYYTKMELDLTDRHNPWHLVFDHVVPRDGDGTRVVITSAFINAMKSDLSEDEFWQMILSLANYRRHGTIVEKIHLRYWNRDQDPMAAAKRAPVPPGAHIRLGRCALCGERFSFVFTHTKTQYCAFCSGFRRGMHDRGIPRETEDRVCARIRKHGFTCHFTGMTLELTDYRDPWHFAFAHLVPSDPTSIVLTSRVICAMKSDLTEAEFWYYILQLADYKQKGKPIRIKKLTHWYRLPPIGD